MFLIFAIVFLFSVQAVNTAKIDFHVNCMRMIRANETCYRPYSKNLPLLCINTQYPHKNEIYICPSEVLFFYKISVIIIINFKECWYPPWAMATTATREKSNNENNSKNNNVFHIICSNNNNTHIHYHFTIQCIRKN